MHLLHLLYSPLMSAKHMYCCIYFKRGQIALWLPQVWFELLFVCFNKLKVQSTINKYTQAKMKLQTHTHTETRICVHLSIAHSICILNNHMIIFNNYIELSYSRCIQLSAPSSPPVSLRQGITSS